MARTYNDPAGGSPSSISKVQQRTNYFKRKAMTEAVEDIIFGQFSDNTNQPKHMGKEIVQDHYLPILHDANINDQGIDAAGVSVLQKVTIRIIAAGVVPSNGMDDRSLTSFGTHYAVGEGATAAAALTAAKADAVNIFKQLNVFDTDYATTKAAVLAGTPAWIVTELPSVAATGNLYGSSRDISTVTGKLPRLTEAGGRVNRVGMTRVSIKSKLQELGYFDEYSKDSIQFDSDADIESATHREMLRAATEISEDALQMDLLSSAGMVRFGGAALSTSEMTGETGGITSEVVYDDFMRLDMDLTKVGAPKTISAITGSTNVDTRTVQGGRVLIVGSEMIPTLKKMQDNFGRPAFKELHEYQGSGYKPLRGEVGAIDGFHIVLATRMMFEAGAGKTVTNNGGFRETNGKYDVFPMLAISKGAFTEVGLRGDKATNGKFNIMHKKPGLDVMDYQDPFGKTGRRSIQWWYGMLVQRPERIAVLRSIARV